jgi:hypothetical protein
MAKKGGGADADVMIQALDTQCNETEQLKVAIIEELGKINDELTEMLTKFKAAQGADLTETFKSVKTFLDSSTGIMAQVKRDVDQITSTGTRIGQNLQTARANLR